MRAKCIKMIRDNQNGKDLTDDDINTLEKNLKSSIKNFMIENPGSASKMGREELVMAAAEYEYNSTLKKAKAKEIQLIRSMDKVDSIEEEYRIYEKEGGKKPTEVLERMLRPDFSGKTGLGGNLFVNRKYFRDKYASQIITCLNMTANKYHFIKNVEGVTALVHEMFGRESEGLPYKDWRGNTQYVSRKIALEAKEAAKAWRDLNKSMIEEFNSLGGDIRYLADWILPNNIDPEEIFRLGLKKSPWYKLGLGHDIIDENSSREAFADLMVDRVTPERYINDEGKVMSREERYSLFKDVIYNTLVTGGLNKEVEGVEGKKIEGKRTLLGTRNIGSRKIFIKGPQEWIEINQAIGKKEMSSMMLQHVNNMADDIAETDLFVTGRPLFYTLLNRALLDERGGLINIEDRKKELLSMYDALTKPPMMANEKSAITFENITKYMASQMLGSASITSAPGDFVNMTFAAGGAFGKHVGPYLKSLAYSLNPNKKNDVNLLKTLAIFNGEINNQLQQVSMRYAISGKLNTLSNSIYRAGGLPFWTESVARASQMGTFSNLGRISKEFKSMSEIADSRQKMSLERYSVNDDILKTWNIAVNNHGFSAYGMDDILTHEAVYRVTDDELKAAGIEDTKTARRTAAMKLNAIALQESMLATSEPSVKTRMMVGGAGETRGTFRSILWTSLMQFKSFPLQSYFNFMERSKTFSSYGRVGYMAGLIAAQTIAGSMSLGLASLITGRNLPDSTKPEFWLKSFAAGGVGGVYSLFLSAIMLEENFSLDTLTSGTIGTVKNIGKIASDVVHGRTDKAAREAVSVTANNVPYTKLFYTKGVINHYVIDRLMDWADPGYLSKAIARDAKRGNTWFWKRGSGLSEANSPDFSKALGK